MQVLVLMIIFGFSVMLAKSAIILCLVNFMFKADVVALDFMNILALTAIMAVYEMNTSMKITFAK